MPSDDLLGLLAESALVSDQQNLFQGCIATRGFGIPGMGATKQQYDLQFLGIGLEQTSFEVASTLHFQE